MKPSTRLLAAPGEETTLGELGVPKAVQFAQYLRNVGSEAFAALVEVRHRLTPAAEIVVFRVEVERPQKLAYDIERLETLAAVFLAEDDGYPEVLALRDDFPQTPHLNLRQAEFPRSLCLYDQPYETVRLTWTPSAFLKRIHLWLSKNANGTLHGEDQPLEPLILGAPWRLIVPADFDAMELHQNPRLLDVFHAAEHAGQHTLIARWQQLTTSTKVDSIAVTFTCSPQPHGVIRHCPSTLGELQALCLNAGLNLADELLKTLQHWHLTKPVPNVLKAKLILILVLPKTRRLGGPTESLETRAFLTLKTVEEVGVLLGIMGNSSDVAGGAMGYMITSPAVDSCKLESIPLALVEVLSALDRHMAATFNGAVIDGSQVLAIGMGAFGSQVANNLVRAGFGRWTVVDADILLPHNCARHLLPAPAVGYNKGVAVAATVNGILDGEPVAAAIAADVLKPGAHAEQLAASLNKADLVLDFSASVPVSRHLARLDTKARHLSAFVTPTGDGLVITAEDTVRNVRLDWLEMLHYRAVLNEPFLRNSLQSSDWRRRYGNACRDVTTVLAQDDIAIWAGVASKEVKRLSISSEAALHIYRADLDGSTRVFQPPISETITVRLADWTILLDKWLLEKMETLRQEKLPNETGGVLIGSFDTHSRLCAIVDLLPSPPDSTEWPTTYIRGCNGLREKVEEIQDLLLGQIGYVGEWHSHPEGFSVDPSEDDRRAYSWLLTHMHAEALPGIMLIVGDKTKFCLVSDMPVPD